MRRVFTKRPSTKLITTIVDQCLDLHSIGFNKSTIIGKIKCQFQAKIPQRRDPNLKRIKIVTRKLPKSPVNRFEKNTESYTIVEAIKRAATQWGLRGYAEIGKFHQTIESQTYNFEIIKIPTNYDFRRSLVCKVGEHIIVGGVEYFNIYGFGIDWDSAFEMASKYGDLFNSNHIMLLGK